MHGRGDASAASRFGRRAGKPDQVAIKRRTSFDREIKPSASRRQEAGHMLRSIDADMREHAIHGKQLHNGGLRAAAHPVTLAAQRYDREIMARITEGIMLA